MKRVKRWYWIVWTEVNPFAWAACVPFLVALNFILGALVGAVESLRESWEVVPSLWKSELFTRERRREILWPRRHD